jgi:hypothetical protein
MTDPKLLIGAGIAGWMLLMLAFPNDFMPRRKPKKTQVGPTFWGIYDGSSPEDAPAEKKIVLNPLITRQGRMVVGSTMYAQGRGTGTRM